MYVPVFLFNFCIFVLFRRLYTEKEKKKVVETTSIKEEKRTFKANKMSYWLLFKQSVVFLLLFSVLIKKKKEKHLSNFCTYKSLHLNIITKTSISFIRE